MSSLEKLIVFEGVDGAGKTTLAQNLYQILRSNGVKVHYFSFPGKEPKTLGDIIYKIHHDKEKFGICNIDPTSLQILHIAAHIDTITSKIYPLLKKAIGLF